MRNCTINIHRVQGVAITIARRWGWIEIEDFVVYISDYTIYIYIRIYMYKPQRRVMLSRECWLLGSSLSFRQFLVVFSCFMLHYSRRSALSKHVVSLRRTDSLAYVGFVTIRAIAAMGVQRSYPGIASFSSRRKQEIRRIVSFSLLWK